MQSTRTFEDRVAVRGRVPLFVGLYGPSGSGKTYSALRLAVGIQRVTGGDIFGVDTEAGRMEHYADEFTFRHVPFGAPFEPLHYLAALEHCVKKGAGVIIVDSMSHEHEGPGGVLEMHAREALRMAKGDPKKVDKVKMLAWSKPKQDRRRLINTILQMPANIIFCFRAKKKLEIVTGQQPKKLGWMPLAGEEFIYEMTVCGLLKPGSNGVPVWTGEFLGERDMIKFPKYARGILGREQKLSDGKGPAVWTPTQLDEDIGERLAKWAAGTVARTLPEVMAALETVNDNASLGMLRAEARALYKKASKGEQQALEAAIKAATSRLEAAVQDLPLPEPGQADDGVDEDEDDPEPEEDDEDDESGDEDDGRTAAE